MPDFFTACLKSDAATVIAILTAAPFKHTHVKTYGDFSNGDLMLEVYQPGGAPRRVGAVRDAGDKVIIHTQTTESSSTSASE
jgi:hypothetical protein